MGLLRITLTLLALLLLPPLLQAETSNVSGDTPITSHKAAIDVVEREHITHEHHAGRADFDDDIPTKRYRIDFDDHIPKPYKAATHHDSAAGANAALSHNTHNENTSNDDIEIMPYLLILACAVIVLKPTRPSL